MPGVNPGEVWMIDFGMAAKVRPALLLTGEPAADELDLVTVVLHTTALRCNRWELNIPKPFLKPGAFPPATGPDHFYSQTRAAAWRFDY
jgi:mRNA interferase MazF